MRKSRATTIHDQSNREVREAMRRLHEMNDADALLARLLEVAAEEMEVSKDLADSADAPEIQKKVT